MWLIHPPPPLGREEILSWETESLEKQDFLISYQSLGTQFLNAWCLMLDARCLMLEAWGLRLEAWCLMLDAWCLNTCQTHPQRIPQREAAEGRPPFVEAAEGRLPLWMGLAGVQASSIKHLFCHQSTHHGSWSTFDQTDLDYFSARVFSKFWDFQICQISKFEQMANTGFEISKIIKVFWGDPGQNGLFWGPFLVHWNSQKSWKCWVWEVWYYQSGPKSVNINPYGIPEPPNH